ncbi:MAG: rhomboid family intramembrane serine protease, partial [Desulfobulbaceae bacterium]|nr:rhomboid family intramembrane serine protease [Desulfobulbaceae bacterium]
LAALTYGFINSSSTGPLVGASGAISGIMGAYCVLYGTRKIKVFITTGFYFNNFRLPAIVLLPFWLGKELYQFVTMGDVSNVAFMAHFGGMAAGATLAFIHTRIKRPLIFDDLEEQTGSLQRDLEEGVRYMAELNSGKAREIFNRLLISHPDNHDILEKLFEVEKLDPRPSSLHPTTARYLALMVKNVEFEYDRLLDTFNRYIELSSKDLRLPPNLLFSLLTIFCKKGDLNEAIAVVSTLVKKHETHPKTPRALLHLAVAGDKNKMVKVKDNCYKLLQRKFPNSPEYARAGEILGLSIE